MKKKKIGVIVFPGSNCDEDCIWVLRDVLGQEAVPVWHKERKLDHLDGLILPGGFSYGDYLRTGAIARFSPVMAKVEAFARKGKPVLGICNGFQILLEAGLLPGAMLRNRSLRFECRFVHLRVETNRSPFVGQLKRGEVLRMPIAHQEGNYYADRETLARLNGENRVVLRYVDQEGEATEEANPNGSCENIAGISNGAGNVFGLMPHPERSSEGELGSEDGRKIFQSLLEALN